MPRRFGNVGVGIEGVSGTIAGGARAALVEIDQERVRLDIRGISTQVRLEPLLWQTLSTPDTKVDSVSVEVKRAPPPQPGAGSHEPQFLPRWLTIDIGHAEVGQALVIVPDGTRITGTGISGSALLRHRDIRFYQAQVQMGEVHFDVAGQPACQRSAAAGGEWPDHLAAARPAGVAARRQRRRAISTSWR